MPLNKRLEDGDEPKAARAEDDEQKNPDAEGDSEPDMGTEPSGKCAACGSANEENAKFCDQCGGSMAAPRADDEEPPPSSKPKPGESTRLSAPKAMSAEASLASILGASSDSIPAVKKAAIELRQIRDAAVGVFGKDKPREIVGAILAVPERLSAGSSAVAELAARTRAEEKRERWSLAHRLNKLGLAGRPRSTIFLDQVEEKSGKRIAVKLQPEYARMELDVFRGLVEALEKDGAKNPPRNPFQPDRERAEEASLDAGNKALVRGEPTAAQIERATREPAVIRIFNSPTNKHPIEKIAKQFLLAAAAAGGVQ